MSSHIEQVGSQRVQGFKDLMNQGGKGSSAKAKELQRVESLAKALKDRGFRVLLVDADESNYGISDQMTHERSSGILTALIPAPRGWRWAL